MNWSRGQYVDQLESNEPEFEMLSMCDSLDFTTTSANHHEFQFDIGHREDYQLEESYVGLGKRSPSQDIFLGLQEPVPEFNPSQFLNCRESQDGDQASIQDGFFAFETDSADFGQSVPIPSSQFTAKAPEVPNVRACLPAAKPLKKPYAPKKLNLKFLSEFVDEQIRLSGPRGLTEEDLRKMAHQMFGKEPTFKDEHRVNKAVSRVLAVTSTQNMGRVEEFKDEQGNNNYRLFIYNPCQIELNKLHAEVEPKRLHLEIKQHDLRNLTHMHQVIQAVIQKNKQVSEIKVVQQLPDQHEKLEFASCDQQITPKVGVAAVIIPSTGPNSVKIEADPENLAIIARMESYPTTLIHYLMQLYPPGSL
jgi:hypothetical protein